MITYVDFSLFDSPAKVLVNTVNTVGVMGKGLAKEFKGIYPEMFDEYQRLCEARKLDIGKLWIYKSSHKWVLNFPTKRQWRNPSKPEYLEAGLEKFVEIFRDARITSISFPQLGCGNGELDWETESKPLMEKYLNNLPIEVFIHVVYSGSSGFKPEHKVPGATKKWLREQPGSLAFAEIWDDLVDVVNTKAQFPTLGGNSIFEAAIFDDSDGGGIKIVDAENTAFLHKEQLLDLWQQVRNLGICIPQIMPSGLDFHSSYVIPLLAELPYFRRIGQAENDNDLNGEATGLLIEPYQNTVNATSIEPEARQLQLV